MIDLELIWTSPGPIFFIVSAATGCSNSVLGLSLVNYHMKISSGAENTTSSFLFPARKTVVVW